MTGYARGGNAIKTSTLQFSNLSLVKRSFCNSVKNTVLTNYSKKSHFATLRAKRAKLIIVIEPLFPQNQIDGKLVKNSSETIFNDFQTLCKRLFLDFVRNKIDSIS